MNYDGSFDPVTRIVLQKETNSTILNVVILVYPLQLGCYEVTVKTAMCENDFRIGDGQFAVRLFESGATLFKCDNRNLKEILSV